MRLFELLNEAPPVMKYHNNKLAAHSHLPEDPLANEYRRTKYYGGGNFADVYGHDDNPHDVVKVSRPRHKARPDGYEAFVRELARDPSMYENIHFPRIQIMRTVYDKATEERQYIVRMEKLYAWNELSMDELEIMVTHTFRDSFIASVVNNLPEWARESKWKHVYGSWLEKSFVSSTYIPEKAYAPLKLPALQQALEKIGKIAEQENVRIDIHASNIMFRKTQYGPVLVITDPLSGRQY